MSASDIRADLYSVISSIVTPSLGVVHDYKRWSTLYDDFISLFKTTINGEEVIRGSEIECGTFTEEYLQFYGSTRDGVLRTWKFYVHAYVGWDDSAESEKTAQDVAERIGNALDDSYMLRENYYHVGPAQLVNYEPRLFGNVLVHYIRVRVDISEFQSAPLLQYGIDTSDVWGSGASASITWGTNQNEWTSVISGANGAWCYAVWRLKSSGPPVGQVGSLRVTVSCTSGSTVGIKLMQASSVDGTPTPDLVGDNTGVTITADEEKYLEPGDGWSAAAKQYAQTAYFAICTGSDMHNNDLKITKIEWKDDATSTEYTLWELT